MFPIAVVEDCGFGLARVNLAKSLSSMCGELWLW
jgi:hypothetical protein